MHIPPRRRWFDFSGNFIFKHIIALTSLGQKEQQDAPTIEISRIGQHARGIRGAPRDFQALSKDRHATHLFRTPMRLSQHYFHFETRLRFLRQYGVLSAIISRHYTERPWALARHASGDCLHWFLDAQASSTRHILEHDARRRPMAYSIILTTMPTLAERIPRRLLTRHGHAAAMPTRSAMMPRSTAEPEAGARDGSQRAILFTTASSNFYFAPQKMHRLVTKMPHFNVKSQAVD